MIDPAFAVTMARYNAWQNRSLYAAAATLDDDARRLDRGAFFRSIHGTLSHLAWGDTVWLARFTGAAPPQVTIKESPGFVPDWAGLVALRDDLDRRIAAWASELTADGLSGDLRWFSGALGRDVAKPKAMLVVHMFNHQTHHRGQVHAMLTAAGARPADTDLFAMPEAQ